MQQEEWRPIDGFPGYEVSSRGRVVSLKRKRPRELRGSSERGYRSVHLYRDGEMHARTVHVLVAEAFLKARPVGAEVRHLDGDPTNNHIANLAFGSPSRNRLDSVEHGTHLNARKTHCPQGHPYDEANTYRRPSAPDTRECRACRRRAARAAA